MEARREEVKGQYIVPGQRSTYRSMSKVNMKVNVNNIGRGQRSSDAPVG